MDLVSFHEKGLTMKCLLCDDPAVAIFDMPRGCACRAETRQALCSHHAFKATPRAGMILTEDLTEGMEFTDIWLHSRVFPPLSEKEVQVLGVIEKLSQPPPPSRKQQVPPRYHPPRWGYGATSDSDLDAD